MNLQPTIWESERMPMEEAVDLTAASLRTYGPRHDHWAIAWSGGKDSTLLLTCVLHLLKTGRVARPQRLTICYADTRMELPALSIGAQEIIARLKADGEDVRVVMAPLDKRFFVYMLGRGVPPPNNNTFRWCTRQIKVEPMQAELKRIAAEAGGKVLMLTGVRLGESAVRDRRIVMSCSRDGAECGQGWYQETLPGTLCDTLAPILHWRVCLVWDWLMLGPKPTAGWAIAPDGETLLQAAARIKSLPKGPTHGYPTQTIAEAYGADEEGSPAELGARTGCVGCPLANRDTALDGLLKNPKWAYLEPLKRLRPIYRALRLPENRLRQPGGETRQDGTPVGNQHRMGPLIMAARRWALGQILDVQACINVAAVHLGRPVIDILNAEEVARIEKLIAANTWPQKWTGDEPRADEAFIDSDGQGLFELMEGGGR